MYYSAASQANYRYCSIYEFNVIYRYHEYFNFIKYNSYLNL